MNIHQEGVSSPKRIASVGVWLAVCGMCLVSARGIAQNITMQDGGSTAIVNPGNGSGLLGMNSWSVDTLNQSQLNQQWFWFAINGGLAQTIDSLGAVGSPQLGYGSDGINDVLMSYGNSQLSATIEYILTGNGVGSGSADMQEAIGLKNIGNTTITLSFIQYSDFNLLGGQSDTVNILGSAGAWTGATQSTGSGGSGLAEVINAPNANYAEANTVGGPNSTLYKLGNTANLTLSDNASAGPGDVTWALQWVTTLNPGESFDISKDKGLSIQIVPEPSTLAVIALGFGALGLTLRRKLS